MKKSHSNYQFDARTAIQHYMNKKYDLVCNMIIETLAHFNTVWYSGFSPIDYHRLEEFVSTFLYLFTRQDFQIPNSVAPVFANLGHIVANVVSMSSYRTTDGVVEHVLNQQNNFYRLLPLLSVYNRTEMDIDKLVSLNPKIASIWWLTYQTAAPGSLTPEIHRKMVEQYYHIPEQFSLNDCRVAPVYFQVSYFAPEQSRALKSLLNKQVSQMINVKIYNEPNPKSIAIVSARWQPSTAVYKSIYPQVATLAEKYDLTLVHTGEGEDKIDRSIFKRVHKIKVLPGFKLCDISEIQKNDFQLMYFPDIGMNFESVWLSNVRLAPIMVTGYGHPVSTFGSQIDYFIGGQEVERIDLAEENYDERLVLLPGFGCHPVDPKYTRQGQPTKNYILINCCWTTHKINYPMLCMLRNIQKAASCPVKIQFFPSWTLGKYNNLIYFVNTLNEFFGEGNWQYFVNLDYQAYLREMEKADFSIDSYPFGGYNTIIDSLFVGCPVVSIEGNTFANRASSALLRRVGLDNLITHSIDECQQVALNLVENPEQLKNDRNQLVDVGKLQQLLLKTDEPQYFCQAIDYLIENHVNLKDGKKPIIIGT